MKNLFKLVSIAALAAVLVAPTFAQDPGPGGKREGGQREGRAGGPGGGMKRMAEMEKQILSKLDLTAVQTTKIEALNKKFQADVKELMEEMKGQGNVGQPGDRKGGGKLGELRKSHHDTMMKILTPSQQENYKTLRKEMMEKLKEKGGNRPGGGRKGGAKGGAGAGKP